MGHLFFDPTDFKVLPNENRGAGPVITTKMTPDDWKKYGNTKYDENLKKKNYAWESNIKRRKEEDNIMGRNALNKDNLLKYIKEGLSLQEIVRKFGANESNVKRAIEHYDFHLIYDIPGFNIAEIDEQMESAPIVTLEETIKKKLKVSEYEGEYNRYRIADNEIIILDGNGERKLPKNKINETIEEARHMYSELLAMCEELEELKQVI